MKSIIEVKDRRIVSTMNLDDGAYEVKIKEKDVTHTLEQIKKLWATIDDISRKEYGDISESETIYFQILNMAGVKTYKYVIPTASIKDFRKKVRSMKVISDEVIDHQAVSVVNVCLKGVSEMSKKEVSQVIETTVKWASELGIETELN